MDNIDNSDLPDTAVVIPEVISDSITSNQAASAMSKTTSDQAASATDLYMQSVYEPEVIRRVVHSNTVHPNIMGYQRDTDNTSINHKLDTILQNQEDLYLELSQFKIQAEQAKNELGRELAVIATTLKNLIGMLTEA